jgi:glycosyltransferase involved in cell wall biosynthesis/ubiquinone/menaquinone biosynthesis C-methylase UbiE
MRILQIAHGVYPYSNAGVEIYTHALSQELIRRGHDVLVAAHCSYQRELTKRVDVPVRELPWPKDHRWGDDVPKKSRMELISALQNIIQEFNPSVIHVQHLINIGWENLAELQRLNTPFILSLPDYWYLCRGIQRRCQGSLLACTRDCLKIHPARPHRFLYEYFQNRQRLKRSAGLLNTIAGPLVSISRRTAEIYESAGIESGRIVVQPWGIKPFTLQRNTGTKDQGQIRFGYIGSVIKPKGVDVLIRAFLKLSDNSSLYVFGNGEPSLLQELQDIAAGSKVFFCGAYDHSDIPRILSKVDVIIVPSVWEEVYGLVVQEAFAAKKIVIASAVGGLKERIYNGVNGFLFPPGDHDILASQMSHVAKNYEDLKHRMLFDLSYQDIAVDGERFENLYNWTIQNWEDLCQRKVHPVDWELSSLADSLSKFLNEDKMTVARKVKKEFQTPGSSVQAAWTIANPKTDTEIMGFYERTDSYLYDLLLVHRTPERRRWRKVATSLLMKYGVNSLLDYAGGCGDDSLHFSKLGIDCTLYDISLLNTGFAKFRAEELNIKLDVMNSLPENRKFDAIFCTEFLEHAPEPFEEIKNMSRLLLNGGIIILTHSFELLGKDYPSHLERHRGLSTTFISQVEKLGFEHQETVAIPYNQYLVFRKSTVNEESALNVLTDIEEVENSVIM